MALYGDARTYVLNLREMLAHLLAMGPPREAASGRIYQAAVRLGEQLVATADEQEQLRRARSAAARHTEPRFAPGHPRWPISEA